MTNNEREPTEVSRSRNGYLWGILAVLSCPCHLPILAIVLAGTSAGAFVRAVAEPTTKGLQQVTVRCRIRYGSRPTVCQMLITRVYIYIIAGEN